MKHLRTEITINAPVENVWRVLTNYDSYPAWNPFVVHIEGGKSPGEKLKLLIHLPGKSAMVFHPKILVFEENRELRWIGRLLIPGLFDGEHFFQLQSIDSEKTQLIHGEHFRGILVPLLWKSMETRTKEGFIAMNEALKTAVESAVAYGHFSASS